MLYPPRMSFMPAFWSKLPFKVCFHRNMNDANAKNMAKSNIHILRSKSSLNMHGVLSIVRMSPVLFGGNLFLKKCDFFFANVSSLPWPIDDASEPPHKFGKLFEPRLWMLDFAMFSTFSSFANCLCAPWKHYIYKLISKCSAITCPFISISYTCSKPLNTIVSYK